MPTDADTIPPPPPVRCKWWCKGDVRGPGGVCAAGVYTRPSYGTCNHACAHRTTDPAAPAPAPHRRSPAAPDALNLLLEAYRPPAMRDASFAAGRGILIPAGGETYLLNALVCVRLLRRLGCQLPVQIWHIGPGELVPWLAPLFGGLGVTFVDAVSRGFQRAKWYRPYGWREGHRYHGEQVDGFRLKAFALAHCDYAEALHVDPDVAFLRDPSPLFGHAAYQKNGCILWPDLPDWPFPAAAWPGLVGRAAPAQPVRDAEAGLLLFDRRRCWQQIWLAWRACDLHPLTFRLVYGDKSTFMGAMLRTGKPFAMPAGYPGAATGEGGAGPGPNRVAHVQYDLDYRELAHHRVGGNKWRLP